MNALLLAAVIAAAPASGPRVAAAADTYVFIPRLDKLQGITSFTNLAGKKSVMFKPVVWSEELVPLIGLDLTSEASIAAAGIDPAGPFTTSFLPAGRIACASLKDSRVFVDRGNTAVNSRGLRWEGTLPLKGGSYGAAVGENKGAVLGGFVQKGNVGCVVQSPKGRGASLMEDALKLLDAPPVPPSWKSAASLPGVIYAVADEGVVGITADGATLTADTKSLRLPMSMPALKGAGPSPYADIPHRGMFTFKARVDPAALPAYAKNFGSQLASFCPGCDAKVIGEVTNGIAAQLTGQVMLRVESLLLGGSMRGNAGKYFAVRHAYVAEISDPAAVKALITKLETTKGVRKTPNGIALVTSQGDVDLGVYGKHLCVSNDSAARQTTLQLLGSAKGGKLVHGAEFTGDPKLLGRALKQISLLDAVGNQEMAGLFAAGVEMGPLLQASTGATGWADSAGSGYRAQLNWTLENGKKPSDGGVQ